jgi:hypothetical protein
MQDGLRGAGALRETVSNERSLASAPKDFIVSRGIVPFVQFVAV